MSYEQPIQEEFSFDSLQKLENLPRPTKTEPSFDNGQSESISYPSISQTNDWSSTNNPLSPPGYQLHEQQEETHTPSYSLQKPTESRNEVNQTPQEHSQKIRDILSRYSASEQQQQQQHTQQQPQQPPTSQWASTQYPPQQSQRYSQPTGHVSPPPSQQQQQQQQQSQQPPQHQQHALVNQQTTYTRPNSAPPVQPSVQNPQYGSTQIKQPPQQQYQQHQQQSQPQYFQMQGPKTYTSGPTESSLNAPQDFHSVGSSSYPTLPQQWQPPAVGITKQDIKIEEVKQQQQALISMINQMQGQFNRIMNFFEVVDQRLTKLEKSTQEILTQQNSPVTVAYDPSEILQAAKQMEQEQNDAEFARRLQEEENQVTPRPSSRPTPTEVKKREEPRKVTSYSSIQECPICSKKLSDFEIEDHVNSCLDKSPATEKPGFFGRIWGKKEETPKPESKKEEKKPQPTVMYTPYPMPATTTRNGSYPGMQMPSYGYPGPFMMPNGQIVYYSVPQNQ